jgi:nitrogen fixation/metabolism regulation signal transduction histidine kinase
MNHRRKGGDLPLASLSAIAFLYLLLIVLLLFFSRQVLQDLAEGETLTRLVFIPLGIALPIFLFFSFTIQLFRLIRDNREGRPGSRFKTRLTGFFLFITLFASIPQGILTITFISSALEAWFNTEMEDALEGGLSVALRYNNEAVAELESLSTSLVFGNMLEVDAGRGEAKLWHSLTAIAPELSGLQLFDTEGLPIAFFGAPEAMINGPLPDGPEGAVGRYQVGGRTYLRALRKYPIFRNEKVHTGQALLTRAMPIGFEEDGKALTDAIQVFGQYRSYRSSFSIALILLYTIFAVPLLLIALLTAFHTGNEIVKPLVHLEEAMRRVMEGDYSIRLLSEGRDELSILVTSFNEMLSELELSRAKLLQTEKVTAWQEIAQRLAHEIKNPLTPIRLSAERILRAYHNNPEQLGRIVERSVDSIIQEVDGLTTMLQEFRDFARLPAPRLKNTALLPLIEEVAAIYAPVYPNTDFSIASPDPNATISADSAQIKRVFSNLLKNAFESVADKEKGKITIGSDLVRKGNTHYCRIYIEDNGGGIPEDLKEKVFQPYVTTKKNGTGLGLPIVERIIADHRGQIWFETESGIGTTFFLDLPTENS